MPNVSNSFSPHKKDNSDMNYENKNRYNLKYYLEPTRSNSKNNIIVDKETKKPYNKADYLWINHNNNGYNNVGQLYKSLDRQSPQKKKAPTKNYHFAENITPNNLSFKNKSNSQMAS